MRQLETTQRSRACFSSRRLHSSLATCSHSRSASGNADKLACCLRERATGLVSRRGPRYVFHSSLRLLLTAHTTILLAARVLPLIELLRARMCAVWLFVQYISHLHWSRRESALIRTIHVLQRNQPPHANPLVHALMLRMVRLHDQ